MIGVCNSMVDKKFSIGRSSEIYGHFSKIYVEFIQNIDNLGENCRKFKSFKKVSFFALACGKIEIII